MCGGRNDRYRQGSGALSRLCTDSYIPMADHITRINHSGKEWNGKQLVEVMMHYLQYHNIDIRIF